MHPTLSRVLLVLLVIALGVVPMLAFSGYTLFQLTLVVSYALSVLGLNMVTGYNGQISLGHGAFYAIGAYTTAIMMDHWDFPYWSTIPVTMVLCAIVGFLIGFPALRFGGLYLALTTLALAAAVPQLLKYDAFSGWTGGVQGVSVFKPDAPFGLPLTPDQWLYLFSFLVALALFILARNLAVGRIGRAMKAIRDQPLAAEAMGINLARIKTRSFAVSAVFTGVGGSLAALAVGFVAPDTFNITLSIILFVGMVVGGAASISGAVFGALFIQFVPNVADQISKAAPGAVYGVILIVVMFVAPGGIAGLVRKYLPVVKAPSRPG
jgi:branched-chain amino acid transport system permease protein